VAGKVGNKRVPLVGTGDSFDQPAASGDFPKEVHSFLPDQLIVDDAVAHWSGRSLAVGLPGKPGLRSGKLKATDTPPPTSDPLQLAVKIPDRDCMLLRFGWLYAFRLRPIFLTGILRFFRRAYAQSRSR
jgi:hypothetical protein